MKPKTKLQVEVFQNAQRLLKHDKDMIEFAKTTCLKHVGYATKTRVICMECGEKFSSELIKRKRATCPHCNHKLVIEDSRKSTFEQKTYVAIAELYGEFQLIRNYLIESSHRVGMKAQYSGYEILQHWYLNDKKREVVARNHYVSFGCNTWTGYLEIRDKGQQKYWESSPRYDVYPEKYHPSSVFKKEYEKYGINHKLEEFTFLEAVRILPANTEAETLLKAKQYSLASAFRFQEGNKIRRNWASIKICMRNKYIVSDSGMWFDYLDLLYYFQKDRHNAHYVCPKNLKKAHDTLMNKKRAIQKKKADEEKRLKALKDEELFQQLKHDFFGLIFKDDLIQVKALESVSEFMEEGNAMHHCVFTNEYYLKPDSLILSATIEGKRIETVEVSLKQFKVVQSRGVCNKNTEYHDRIVGLVNRNIKHIRKRINQSA